MTGERKCDNIYTHTHTHTHAHTHNEILLSLKGNGDPL